jgi:DNA-binding response OmpR family regulator
MSSRNESSILLVDDNRTVLKTLLMILQLQGYAAEGVSSVAAAQDYLGQNRPHLVIADVNLPDGNGVDLAIQLRTVSPQTLILLTSGDSSGSPALERARQQGFDFELVSKPIAPPELLAKIEALLASKRPT